jgi:hypothetical protein
MTASIIVGAIYVYNNEHPANCTGHLYRAHRIVLDVPTYQRKVLVEGLSGCDEGLWYTCTVDNFNQRFSLAEPVQTPVGTIAGTPVRVEERPTPALKTT